MLKVIISEAWKRRKVLSTKFTKAVHKDDYGNFVGMEDWQKELNYFIKMNILPKLADTNKSFASLLADNNLTIAHLVGYSLPIDDLEAIKGKININRAQDVDSLVEKLLPYFRPFNEELEKNSKASPDFFS